MIHGNGPVTMRSRRAAPSLTAGFLALFFAASFLCYGWSSELSIPSYARTEQLERHVRYLASSDLMGRGVDTPGIDLAKEYIGAELKKYGLAPGGDSGTFFQTLEVVSGVTIQDSSALALGEDRRLALGQDWTPLGFSRSTEVQGELVFAGYGITVKDYDYDDYAGLDVKGKIVLVLRYEPPPKDENSPFRKPPRYSNYASLRFKASNARDHGAIGMLLVDLDPARDGNRELMPMRRSLWRSEAGLAAAQVKSSIVDGWLQESGYSLAALKERIDRDETPASIALPGFRVSLNVSLERITKKTANVVGMLLGSDPVLKESAVVIGAHYDHLGLGHYGTRDASTEGQIHHGADDNASGTAVVLEVARRLSAAAQRPPRTVIFALFTGEELGLYGSRHYVNHPPLPLRSTRAMINLDMVGRMKGNEVIASGMDTAQEFRSIVAEAAKKANVDIKASSRRGGGSDHTSFQMKEVPALHFFTGIHKDYHRPSDTWDKLNLEGMARVADLALAAVEEIATGKRPLLFVRAAAPSAPAESREGYGSYLGTIPDFAESEKGVRLAGVQAGSPAARAGLREGDVIIRLAEMPVESLEDLASALRRRKPGEEVPIVILREGRQVTLKAVLRRRG